MKPFSQSLVFREVFCTIHTPSSPLFRHEDATEKYQFCYNNGIIYLSVCFSFSVSWCLEMQCGVICLETWGRRQPHVVFWTLEFRSFCFVCSRPRTAPSYLPLPGVGVHCLASSLISWLSDGACLTCLEVRVRTPTP
jgi:hypothetical protein